MKWVEFAYVYMSQKQKHISNTRYSLQETASYDKMQQFWKNYNEAKISNEVLRNQKSNAILENKKLRKLLRFYMASIRRSSSVPRKCGF